MHVDPDLADLIPGYLANRKKDIAAIHAALEKKALYTVRMLGHNMKGSGVGYGFETITDIGMMMEKAAKEGPALDGEEDRRKAFAVGAADYLAKPVQKERLLTKVEEQIKTRLHWQDLKERVVC
ncbi:MAG: hypothetical protein NTY86_20730 [Deltaproteobacteria bacterium]|nr:hypothetical protein [Deltaproteobacteria bacterium]